MLKKQKIILIAIAIIIIGFAMKSWGALRNYRELDELSIVSAIGIDKEESGTYSVSVQIMNTKKEADGSSQGDESSQIMVYNQSARTITLALQNIIKELPKKLYTAHMSLLVIDEKLAREDGISIILDYFFRDVESNKEFVTLIARDTSANKILQTLTPVNSNPARDLVDSYKTILLYQGSTTNSVASNLLELYLETGETIKCASVVLKGNESKAESEEGSNPTSFAEISDIAYFRDDKLEGYLNEFDNVAYNLLNDDISSTIIELEYQGSPLAFEVFKSDTNYNVVSDAFSDSTNLSGQFSINYHIKLRGNIKEISNVEMTQSYDNIEKVQNDISNQIKEKLGRYVYNTKNEYNTDITGIESLIYKYKNKAYKQVKEDFNFKNVKINISVETEIANEGGLLKK